MITGNCDSVARRSWRFEQTVFRQCSTIDSLRNVIIDQQKLIDEYEALEMARSGTTEQVEQTVKKPSNWHKWLLGGVVLGVALCIAVRILWNRTRLGSIIKTLINKVTKLWQK